MLQRQSQSKETTSFGCPFDSYTLIPLPSVSGRRTSGCFETETPRPRYQDKLNALDFECEEHQSLVSHS